MSDVPSSSRGPPGKRRPAPPEPANDDTSLKERFLINVSRWNAFKLPRRYYIIFTGELDPADKDCLTYYEMIRRVALEKLSGFGPKTQRRELLEDILGLRLASTVDATEYKGYDESLVIGSAEIKIGEGSDGGAPGEITSEMIRHRYVYVGETTNTGLHRVGGHFVDGVTSFADLVLNLFLATENVPVRYHVFDLGLVESESVLIGHTRQALLSMARRSVAPRAVLLNIHHNQLPKNPDAQLVEALERKFADLFRPGSSAASTIS